MIVEVRRFKRETTVRFEGSDAILRLWGEVGWARSLSFESGSIYKLGRYQLDRGYPEESPEVALMRAVHAGGPIEPLIDYLLENGHTVLRLGLEEAMRGKE